MVDMQRIEIRYHFFPDADAEEIAQALREHFDVDVRRTILLYPLPVVEIALGVLVAGVGTIALKKIIELLTEDLYKVSKKFLVDLFKSKKPKVEVKLSFLLDDTRCIGKITTDDADSFQACIEALPQLFLIAESIIGSKRIPEEVVLLELYPDDEQNPKTIDSSSQLPVKPDWLTIEFDSDHRVWTLERIHSDATGTFVEQSEAKSLWKFLKDRKKDSRED